MQTKKNLQWKYKAKEFAFQLPDIDGYLLFKNDTVTYDPNCMENFEKLFSAYIDHHSNDFPFKKEIVIINIKRKLDYLQNIVDMHRKSGVIYTEGDKCIIEEHLGTPENGYTYKIILENMILN